jgi:RNA polymerase sigma-70 factor (ECF subfamily)
VPSGVLLPESKTLRSARAPEPSSVAELVARARGGCGRSFGDLVRRFEVPLYNFLLVRTRSASDAEELAQETFLRAWQRIERYDERWSFATWLFTLGKNLAVSRYRARAARPDTSGDDRGLHGLESSSDPARAASERDERENLWRTADSLLGTEPRSALWLRYGEDLEIAEIARVLGKRAVSVRVLLFRARERLARHVREQGGEL